MKENKFKIHVFSVIVCVDLGFSMTGAAEQNGRHDTFGAATANTQGETVAKQHRPQNPGHKSLIQKGFFEKEQGVYVNGKMQLLEAKALFGFETSDMMPIPSGPPTEKSFLISLKEGSCVVTVRGSQNITNETSLVSLVVNTNALPSRCTLTPRKIPPQKD